MYEQGEREQGTEGSGDSAVDRPSPVNAGTILDFSQTPLYRAFHADRYARQEIVRRIQALTGHNLIVYEANEARPGSSICSDDVEAFADLIDRLQDGCQSDTSKIFESEFVSLTFQ
jgi:hypothetical protein